MAGGFFLLKRVLSLYAKSSIMLYTNHMTEIQALIEQLRRKRWTTAAIARALEVTQSTVHRWYRGSHVPDNQVAVRLALRQLLSEPVPKRKYRRRTRG
jgi:DNA-binding transcriptional regulator YiaG